RPRRSSRAARCRPSRSWSAGSRSGRRRSGRSCGTRIPAVPTSSTAEPGCRRVPPPAECSGRPRRCRRGSRSCAHLTTRARWGARAMVSSAVDMLGWAMSPQGDRMAGVSDQLPQGPLPTSTDETLDEAELRARWQDLADRVRGAREAYYNEDTQLMSDAAFDELLRDLQALETSHPFLQRPDSPTQEVGGSTSPLFTPVQHAEQLL